MELKLKGTLVNVDFGALENNSVIEFRDIVKADSLFGSSVNGVLELVINNSSILAGGKLVTPAKVSKEYEITIEESDGKYTAPYAEKFGIVVVNHVQQKVIDENSNLYRFTDDNGTTVKFTAPTDFNLDFSLTKTFVISWNIID